MPRKLSPDERDAILETVAENAADQSEILTRMQERLDQIARAASASPMAILRESLATILADRIKTSALFAFLTVCAVVGAAIYLNSEAALIAVATQATPDAAPPETAP